MGYIGVITQLTNHLLTSWDIQVGIQLNFMVQTMSVFPKVSHSAKHCELKVPEGLEGWRKLLVSYIYEQNPTKQQLKGAYVIWVFSGRFQRLAQIFWWILFLVMMEPIGKMVVFNPFPLLEPFKKVGCYTNSSASCLQQKTSETERIPQIMGNLRYPPPQSYPQEI